MAELKYVIAYICLKYPYKDELSKSRLTKMIYLCDWRSALVNGYQLTDISWEYSHYGPYVDDIIKEANSNKLFNVKETNNIYGFQKDLIKIRDDKYSPVLENSEKSILDFVIKKTHLKNWNDFIRLVYSTFPIVTQTQYSDLDLVKLASLYHEETN